MTSEQFITIKEYLESKNIINISNEETKMDIRKNGHEYTMEEHVAGMLYSLLSAQTVWKNIERNMTNINQLFFNFDIEKIFLQWTWTVGRKGQTYESTIEGVSLQYFCYGKDSRGIRFDGYIC